ALVPLAPQTRWVLYVDRPAAGVPAGAESRCLAWPQRLLWTLWAAPRGLRRSPVDLFHGGAGVELPSAGAARPGPTLPGPIPFRFPHLVPWRHRWAVRLLLGGALRRASRVITVSEATRGEVLTRFRLEPAKVVVVPEAAAPQFAAPAAAEVAR